MFKYMPLIKLAYGVLLRPWMVKQVPRTSNKVDDVVLDVLDHALGYDKSKAK